MLIIQLIIQLVTVRGATVTAVRDGSGFRQPPVLFHGAAGAGKSALALRPASEGQKSFPDGQRYLDLRHYRRAAKSIYLDLGHPDAVARVVDRLDRT